MTVGTKSLLFGVHQFLWHPWTVARAWRHVHGVWPDWIEWVCIFCHDIGYWGCKTMDGDDGKHHPERGAELAKKIVHFFTCTTFSNEILTRQAADAYFLTLYHSSHYARLNNAKPSSLYLPDKASILHEPRWWYLLRATLSGEVREYISNSPLARLHPSLQTAGGWYNWYRGKVKEKVCPGHTSKR